MQDTVFLARASFIVFIVLMFTHALDPRCCGDITWLCHALLPPHLSSLPLISSNKTWAGIFTDMAVSVPWLTKSSEARGTKNSLAQWMITESTVINF